LLVISGFISSNRREKPRQGQAVIVYENIPRMDR
jgi:hypothetical protein